AFFHQLLERVNALPGVEVAGASVALPLSGVDQYWDNTLTVEGESALPSSQARKINLGIITPHYFRALGIPLLAGRMFNDADTRDAPKVAIIDQRLAREYWPSESPLGKRILIGSATGNASWPTIVGVAGAVQHERLDAASRGNVYIPARAVGFQTLAVRSHLPPGSLLAA